MTSPLVSIVVVSYNHSKYINENLDSIKNQIYDNIELILADDASQDNSVEIFDNWLDKNNYSAKKNYHTKNTGLATVLNECIEMATGKYIKIIAADDYLHPEYITKCLDVLIKNNADIVFTNALEIDDESNILKSHYFNVKKYDTISELEALLLEGNFISGATLMTSLNLYKVINCYHETTILEDYNLVLQSINKGIYIYYLDENLIYYRRHGNNITIKRRDKLEIETIKEKIKFDKTGKYSSIIHNEIKEQSKKRNEYLKELNKLYFNYIGFNLKFYILNFTLYLIKLLQK